MGERGEGYKIVAVRTMLEDGTHNLCPFRFRLRTQMLNSATAAFHLINQFDRVSALKSITLNQEESLQLLYQQGTLTGYLFKVA